MEGVYSYFINVSINFVNVRNKGATPLVIPRRQRIGSIVEYEAKEAYPIDLGNYSLIAESYNNEDIVVSRLTNLLDLRPNIAKAEVNASIETKLPNGIIIYGTNEDVEEITKIIEKYPYIQEDTGNTINLPKLE